MDNQDIMGQMMVEYFKNVFVGNVNVESPEEENVGRVISKAQNDRLVAEIKF